MRNCKSKLTYKMLGHYINSISICDCVYRCYRQIKNRSMHQWAVWEFKKVKQCNIPVNKFSVTLHYIPIGGTYTYKEYINNDFNEIWINYERR